MTPFFSGRVDLSSNGSPAADALLPSLLDGLQASGKGRGGLVLDVFRLEDPQEGWLVLLNRDESDAEATYAKDKRCLLGFCNVVRASEWLVQAGFAIITTRIDHDDRLLKIGHPLAPQRLEPLLSIEWSTATPGRTGQARPTSYSQYVVSPDLGRSDIDLVARTESYRVDIDATAGGATSTIVHCDPAPLSLHPLAAGQRVEAWLGGAAELGALFSAAPGPAAGSVTRDLKSSVAQAAPTTPAVPPQLTIRRPSAWVPTGYRFDAVELIGFRLDLGRFDGALAGLEKIVRPLNFHRRGADGARTGGSFHGQDFEYRPAAIAVVVELLRYGKMYWGKQRPASGVPEPYTSQHELLVRLLVGRVDDDSSQGRDPAIHVPAIFVDNPWSMMVGREYQGMDKRLAAFMSDDDEVVQLDGHTAHGRPVPLGGVRSVRRVDVVGAKPGARLLEIQYPPAFDESARWVASANEDDVALGNALIGSGWQSSRLDQDEFRRSFARAVAADGSSRFRSIQTTPIDSRDMPPAWITGRFTFDRLESTFPRGIATVHLHKPDDAPEAWAGISDLLDGPFALPSGSWYRARCSMRMDVDDGLL